MKKYIDVIINMHDEGGASAASNTESVGNDGGTSAGTEIPGAVKARANELGIEDDLLNDYNKAFGQKQEDKTQSIETQEKSNDDEKPDDDNSEFEKLISGKYKSQYDSKVQDIIKSRFAKNNKQLSDLQSRISGDDEIFSLISNKYGIDAKNREELFNAIKNDDDYFQRKAIEDGTTTEQARNDYETKTEILKAQKELDDFRREKAARELDIRLQNIAEETKKIYPNFNLREEMENPDFRDALDFFAAKNSERNKQSGLNDEIFDLTKAYEFTHADEIQKNTVKKIGSAAISAAAQSIASTGRPHEGLSSKGTARAEHKSISDMSDEEFQRLYDDVKAGRRKIPT